MTAVQGVGVVVTGWGTLMSGGSQPRLLHQVALTLLSPLACTSPPSLYMEDMLTERMVCAASPGDSCQVDMLLTSVL